MQIVLSFLVAIQFLTTLRVPIWREPTDQDVGMALRYFPVIGLLLGGLLVLLNWLFGFFLPANLTPLVLVISLLLVTGALHFDGFLDSCDGLMGYKTPDRRLEIMKDSRVGSYAVAGGWVLLSLKYVGLLDVPADLMVPALLLGPMLGRWALVTVVVVFPYGRPSGLGVPFKQHTGKLEYFLAAIVVLVLSAIILHLPGVVLAVVIFIIALAFGKYVLSKLPAGLTGDSYGATAELCETATWVIIGVAAGLIKQYL